MLKANVGVSRKISREFQSTGFSVNLDGEIPFTPDDAEGVLEKIQELFDLAREALDREIDRDYSPQPRNPPPENPPPPKVPVTTNGQSTTTHRSTPLPINRPASSNDQRPSNGSTPAPESATPRQRQYLQTLGKQKHVSRNDLDSVIARIAGPGKTLDDLSKREAGLVIDHLTKLQPETAR